MLEKTTSKEELDKLGDEKIGAWLHLLDAVATLHLKLSEISTEEEWKTISKWRSKTGHVDCFYPGKR